MMEKIEQSQNMTDAYAEIYKDLYNQLPTPDDLKEFALSVCDNIKYGVVHTIKYCIYYRRTHRMLQNINATNQ